jgi:hypothetical protein
MVASVDDPYRPWHELPNPFGSAEAGTTLEQLAQRLVTKPEESAAVYGLIKNRRVAQEVFRLALLLAYGRRCTFYGSSLPFKRRTSSAGARRRSISEWIPGTVCFSVLHVTLSSMPTS